MSLTEFNGTYYRWGSRVEWTPEIPEQIIFKYFLSSDLRSLYPMTDRRILREPALPFIRICCDLCDGISKRIRTVAFRWPWTDKLYQDAAERWRTGGSYIRKELASLETAYCDKCYFRALSMHRRAWDSDNTRKYITRIKKEIKNAVKDNRTASAIFSGRIDSCKERPDGP